MYRNDQQYRRYTETLADYTTAVERISADSLAAANKNAGPQRYWASVLMTRLVTVASGALFICPDSLLNRGSVLWDFGNVAAAIRTIFETVLMLFYIGIEAVSEDEWKLRLTLIHLHDCTERIRLFYSLDSQETLAGFIPTAVWLRAQIAANPSFLDLPDKARRMILKGDNATLFGKAEMIRRMGREPRQMLDYYRFISNYIHNFPFAFHRTGLQGRDGTINPVDVEYSTQALSWAADLLLLAATAYENKFADIVEFKDLRFDVRVLRRNPVLSARDAALIENAFTKT